MTTRIPVQLHKIENKRLEFYKECKRHDNQNNPEKLKN